MPVTIRDVAQRSGFSTSTVSRVLTHHPGISPETRSRVLAVVEEMNYQPNVLARSLVNARTRMLCVVLPTGPFDGREKLILETISGIGQHARDRGYHVVFLHADTQATEHAEILQTVAGRVADGILLFSQRSKDPLIEALKNAAFPFVIVGNPEEYTDELWVGCDYRSTTHRETVRLIELGHRRIGYIGGPLYRRASKTRFEGYFSAHLERGIEIDHALVEEHAAYETEDGIRYVASRLARTPAPSVPFTALITADDRQAVGAQSVLQREGIRGVSLIGFHDLPQTAVCEPPITTITVNPLKVGSYAARLLIDRLEGAKEGVRHYLIRTSTIDRGTVLPPPEGA